MSKLILAAALLAALPLCAQGASAPSVDAQSATILAAVRAAMLQRPLSSIKSLHLAGSQTALGIRATSDEWDDLVGLRFGTAQAGGPLTGASGWDGHTAWTQDGTGLTHVDGGAATHLQSVDQAYFDNLAFLAPNAGGATVAYGGEKTEANRTYDILKVTPPGGSEFDFWIDSRTHLIAKEVGTIGNTGVTVTLSDYRSSHGIEFPFKQTTATSDGNSSTLTLASVNVNQEVASHIAMPVSSVHDASITGGDSTTVPIQIFNNHIYLHGMLNGKGPFTFILDTGGAFIVDPSVVAALKSGSAGTAQIGGVGSTTEAAGFTHIDSLQIGNAIVRNQYALALPIARGFGVAEGVHIDAMIGYEFVARFLTTIDYANSTMTLAPLTAAPAAETGATAIPFFFDRTIPNVAIAIDGIDTNAEFDTGSRFALTLTAPFVADHPTLAADATTANGIDGFGVGGPSFAKLGRVGTLQIGSFTLTHPITAFGTQAQGSFADPLVSANLGGDIWKRFTVTFDYPHYQVLLAPNASFASPFGYDRSGMFLIDNNDAYTVLGVRAGTPAAAAGLQKGDVILAVNGAAASTMTLPQLRTLLTGIPGTAIHLHVKNATGERDVTLTLKNYV